MAFVFERPRLIAVQQVTMGGKMPKRDKAETDTFAEFARRYEYQSDFARKHYFAGYKEGVRIAAMVCGLLLVLERRGLAISSEERERIESCDDWPTIERWFERSDTVAAVAELFELE